MTYIYPKIAAHGKNLHGLFDAPVLVQEKLDGSQFSFGVTDGNLWLRSRRRFLDPKAPNGQFNMAVATVLAAHARGDVIEGCSYFGEAITKCRHNVLTYERVPKGGIVLWDLHHQDPCYGEGWLSLELSADEIGCEYVKNEVDGNQDPFDPFVHGLTCMADLDAFLERPSMLGGPREGVVAKRYDGGTLYVGKRVSEMFKEKHDDGKNRIGKAKGTIIENIVSALATEPRYLKAVGALRDDGTLEGEAKDIGPLIRHVISDFYAEDEEWVKEALWAEYKKVIASQLTRDLPTWYKARLEE